MKLPQQIERAIKSFSRLPGVGDRTAFRQVLSMTKWRVEDLQEFADSISGMESLNYCKMCGFFAEAELCHICSNQNRREKESICVVENVGDLMAIERSNYFDGTYFILGGVLNPLIGIGPEEIRIPQLIEQIEKQNIKSVLLAINPSVEGDATCAYIKQKIGPQVHVDRIGFGIPIGGALEHLDPMTISKALENRKSF